jgi:hypothetical protein
MGEFTGREKALDRRGFLKGSALFAATALGLSAAGSAFAQEPAKPEEKKPEEEKKPAEPSGGSKKEEPATPGQQTGKDPNKLYDKNGREYRVCERCGGNMYKEGNTWTCEQCGLSYVE